MPSVQHPSPGDQRSDRPGTCRVEPAVLDLIRRPYVGEVLAALDEHPHTLASLRHATGAPRRLALAALRALAGHHAVAREPATGSWDTLDDHHGYYQLTTAGRALIERLFHLDVWIAAYNSGTPRTP